MKRVSFEVAKALKEAGYPQNADEGVEHWYCQDGGIDTNLIDDPICSCPTYLEAWLWLWREKKISIYPEECLDKWAVFELGSNHSREGYIYNDPEEAIITAIKYLVDNNLIK